MSQCCERYKKTPRDERLKAQLQNRVSRMAGQLEGIGRMIEDERYCGDILIQLSALEGALKNFGYIILSDHLESCVADEICKGNGEIIAETVELIKKLK